MEEDNPVVSRHETAHGTLGSYITGFALSVLFTLAPYYLVVNNVVTGPTLVLLIGFALLQLLVQLVFFLHLGRESKPRWNAMLLLFAALVVIIVVVGSLWIMNNLNYNMMSPAETEQRLLQEEGIHR
jgi:cytochrome o ubiquinol oxidase subunit IV